MDNNTAREILSAYRPSGEDAHDSIFRDALAQCQHDPDMREWLRSEREFDDFAATALEMIRVPQEGKARLLQTAVGLEISPAQRSLATAERPRILTWSRGFLRAGIGFAATLIVGLLVWQIGFSPQEPALDNDDFTMGSLVSSGMPLSFRADDQEQVVAWLASGGAPVPDGFPGHLDQASALGCRVYELPQGGKISLICLLMSGEVIHFFVFDQQASQLLAYAPRDRWWKEDGWHLYSFDQGDKRIAVATQGQTAHLL